MKMTEKLERAAGTLLTVNSRSDFDLEPTCKLLKQAHDHIVTVEAERDALRQRLHMAEQQIRECRQYLRLDDRDLVVGHIDAYFALPALNSGEGE